MKTSISPRDIELLSAYLDGELDRRNQMKLQKRLDREPELNTVMVDLERTRSLLRGASPIKAPRSFKLKPEMVVQQRRKPTYPVFQFASVVAVVMLAIVLLGDLTGFGLNMSTPSAATVAGETSIAMEAPMAAQERVAEDSAEKEPTIEEESSPELMMAAPSETATPTANPAAGSLMMPTESASDASPLATSEVFSNTVALATGEAVDGFLDQTAGEATEETSVIANWFTPLRIAEIFLAVLAVVFGLLAILLRRKV